MWKDKTFVRRKTIARLWLLSELLEQWVILISFSFSNFKGYLNIPLNVFWRIIRIRNVRWRNEMRKRQDRFYRLCIKHLQLPKCVKLSLREKNATLRLHWTDFHGCKGNVRESVKDDMLFSHFMCPSFISLFLFYIHTHSSMCVSVSVYVFAYEIWQNLIT